MLINGIIIAQCNAANGYAVKYCLSVCYLLSCYCGFDSNNKEYIHTYTYIHLQGPSEQKPMKNFSRKGTVGVFRDSSIFRVPVLSQERVKPRTSNLADTLTGSI